MEEQKMAAVRLPRGAIDMASSEHPPLMLHIQASLGRARRGIRLLRSLLRKRGAGDRIQTGSQEPLAQVSVASSPHGGKSLSLSFFFCKQREEPYLF